MTQTLAVAIGAACGITAGFIGLRLWAHITREHR